MTRFFYQWFFFLPWWHGYIPRRHMPWFIGLKLGKSGSWSMRCYFHIWIGHQRVHWASLGCALLMRPDSPIICTRSWRGMNAALDGNECYDIAQAHKKKKKNIPQWMCVVIKANVRPKKYYSVTFLGAGQCIIIYWLAKAMHAERDVFSLKQSYHYHDCIDLNDLCESNEYIGLIDLLFSPLLFPILMVLPT